VFFIDNFTILVSVMMDVYREEVVYSLEIETYKDFPKVKMILYTNGIMNVIFKDNLLIEMSDIDVVLEWVTSLGSERKYINLMEGASNTDIDSEVREFAASSTNNKHTIADAMVISSAAHRILTNFYLRFNKPSKPTKIFTERSKAITWLLQQKNNFEK
jgi:hypothetical protein